MSHRGLVFRGIVGVSPLTCCTLALAATDLLRLLAGRWSTTATAAAFGEHRARWRPVVFTVARFTRSPRETAKPLPPPTDDEFSYRSRKKNCPKSTPMSAGSGCLQRILRSLAHSSVTRVEEPSLYSSKVSVTLNWSLKSSTSPHTLHDNPSTKNPQTRPGRAREYRIPLVALFEFPCLSR